MGVMRSEFYESYMRSKEWDAKRQQRLQIDNNCCVMCGRPAEKTRNGLQVHHCTYVRLGHENVLTDLCTLCGSCHQKIHRYYNRPQKEGDIINDNRREEVSNSCS